MEIDRGRVYESDFSFCGNLIVYICMCVFLFVDYVFNCVFERIKGNY